MQELFQADNNYFAKGSTMGDCANVVCPGHEFTVVNTTDANSQLGLLNMC